MSRLENISVSTIASGEYVALKLTEIIGIPDISTLTSESTERLSKEMEFKEEFSNLLSKIHQSYTNLVTSEANDLSLEILWITESANNQAYVANIRIFIATRVIDTDSKNASNTVEDLMDDIKGILDIQKYEYRDVTYSELDCLMSNNVFEVCKILKKKSRVDKLQSNILPQCYAFDVIPVSEKNLSRIVSSMIKHPNMMLSIQLIPTIYSEGEKGNIEVMTHILSNLSKGVQSNEGNVCYSLAESCLSTYRHYNENKNGAIYKYNIAIFGTNESVLGISTSIFNQISGDSSKKVSLEFIDLNLSELNTRQNYHSFPWVLDEAIFEESEDKSVGFENFRLSRIISADEASELFRLPIGNDTITAGLNILKFERFNKTYLDNVIDGGDISMGSLRNSPNNRIGISLKDLTKHMLIVGMPGSGKTTFSISLLDRLWKEHGIPFLIIEPVKNEYRALIDSIPELQIYTPGKNGVSPFPFNPFSPPKNVVLESYKSTLKTAFEASVSMSSPLDRIFEDAISNCYSDFNWLDTNTIDDGGVIFNISDFIKCFQKTFDSIGYTGDAKNIGRAGLVRLQGIVKLFDTYNAIPMEDVLKKPTLIELSAIENHKEKSLIISLILLRMLAYVNANYSSGNSLKNVLLLEEAHVLLGVDSRSVEGEADPGRVAQELFKRMLAEIRSYGVGIVVADQSPRKVSTDIVGLTNIKMSFRIVEAQDKQILADCCNMSDIHIQRLSRLRPGESILFFDRMDEPEEIIVEDYRSVNNLKLAVSDSEIKMKMKYWEGKEGMLRPYPQCDMVSECMINCDYNTRLLARDLSRKIFIANIEPSCDDYEVLRKSYYGFEKKVVALLDKDSSCSERLLACTKLHFLRNIKYGSRINITDSTIEKTLKQKGE